MKAHLDNPTNTVDLAYWKQLVVDYPDAGSTVQYDPMSPFDELRVHNTMLHLVVLNFYSLSDPLNVVEVLLRAGANPNIQNDRGETPLHLSCQLTMRDPDIVKLLLARGADPSIRTVDGEAPIDFLGEFDGYSREIRVQLLRVSQ